MTPPAGVRGADEVAGDGHRDAGQPVPTAPCVLPVLHVLPDLAVAGGPRYVLDLIGGSVDGSHVRHQVAALAGGPMRDRFEAGGIATTVLGRGRLGPAGQAWALAKVLRRDGVVVVHTNGTPADRLVGQAAAALTGAAVVNTFHGLPLADLPVPPGGSGRVARARRFARRQVSVALCKANVSAVLAVSQLVRDAHERALGLAAGSMPLVPPGLPPAMLEAPRDEPPGAGAVRRALGLDDRPVLINVGRFDPGKGQETLVAALAELVGRAPGGNDAATDCQLLLVGDGVRFEAAKSLASRLGVADRIVFAGVRVDVRELLDAADCYVTASENEGFGIAPLEAMARRLPVVAVAGGYTAVAEFVQDGVTGVLVHDAAPAAVAAAIGAVLADPGRAQAMGEAGRDAAERRSFAVTTARVEAVYDMVVGGRRRRGGSR